MRDKIKCFDCRNDRCTKGVQDILCHPVYCGTCGKLIGYRPDTKKEKTVR